jgi:hypothetical protein
MRLFNIFIERESKRQEALALAKLAGYENAFETIGTLNAIYFGPVTLKGDHTILTNSMFYKVEGTGIRLIGDYQYVGNCVVEGAATGMSIEAPAAKGKRRAK